MDELSVKVENISKKYYIGKAKTADIKETIANLIKNIFRKDETKEEHEFYALNNVSFELKSGDILGIIGKNGAGKSTILKILSRITAPTDGKITIAGRVTSLLEVGTGFHPELTGRENIYFNGSLLGMTREEIKEKFDEIVEFSGIEKFIDTPVKRYSSGMYVRLAFAVAAHLESEILIVDEVLAVGDAEFQKKCLQKMENVAKRGRIILFVSHNMNAIAQLCNKAIMLEKGKVVKQSNEPREVISYYLSGLAESINGCEWINTGDKFKSPYFTVSCFFITDGKGQIIKDPVKNNDETWVNIEGTIDELHPALRLGYMLTSIDGQVLYYTFQTDIREEDWMKFKPGKVHVRSRFPNGMLDEGEYILNLYIDYYCYGGIISPGEVSLKITISGGISESPYWVHKRPGLLAPVIKWELV